MVTKARDGVARAEPKGKPCDAGDEPEATRGGGLIRVDAIDSYPGQPRVDFDQDRISELAGSIRARGMICPVIVRPAGRRFQLIDGERRLRACKMLGLELIAAGIRVVADDAEQFILAVAANAAREDLSPMERARAMRRIAALPQFAEMSVMDRSKAIAKIFGKSGSWAYEHMRLLDLAPEAQSMIERGEISPVMGTQLLAVPQDRQAAVARDAVAGSMTLTESARRIREETGKTRSFMCFQVRLTREEARFLHALLSDAPTSPEARSVLAQVSKARAQMEGQAKAKAPRP